MGRWAVPEVTVQFGDFWREAGEGLWEGMAGRSSGLPTTDVLSAEATKHTSMIEIGCGAGHVALEYFTTGFKGKYWGCDIGPAAAKATRKRLAGKDAEVEVGNFIDLAAAGVVPKADVAVSRDVIQHQLHWMPLVATALQHAPLVVLGITRPRYFKLQGDHVAKAMGTYYDACISLEVLEKEALAAGMQCEFTHSTGSHGAEVAIRFQMV